MRLKHFKYVNQYFSSNKKMVGSFGVIGMEEVDVKDTDAYVEYTAYLDVFRILELVPLQKIADAYRITGQEERADLVQQLAIESDYRHQDLEVNLPRDHADVR